MHRLQINVVIKGSVTKEQFIQMDKELHAQINQFLFALPVQTPSIPREIRVLESSH